MKIQCKKHLYFHVSAASKAFSGNRLHGLSAQTIVVTTVFHSQEKQTLEEDKTIYYPYNDNTGNL